MKTLDLDINDNSFDIYSGAEGTSFISDPFSYADGEYDNFSNFMTEEQMRAKGKSDDEIKQTMASESYKEEAKLNKPKNKFDAQKTADTITALGSAGASIFGTIKAFQNPDKVANRKLLRDACGNKPLFDKAKKKKYEDCEKQYSSATTKGGATNYDYNPAPNEDKPNEDKGMSTTTKVVIGILVLSVIGFIGYKIVKGKQAVAVQ